MPVNRSKLQLVGVTCMLVAAKYEEIHPPAVDEFVYISDNTYKVRARALPAARGLVAEQGVFLRRGEECSWGPTRPRHVVRAPGRSQRDEILHMEGMVLNRLNFELSLATTKVFINRFLKAAKAGECDSTTEML